MVDSVIVTDTKKVSAPLRAAPSLEADILPVLKRATARLRRERAMCFSAWSLLAVHAIALPWLVVKSLWPLSPITYLALVLLAVVAGAVIGLVLPVSVARAARELDRRLGLDERLQSVLEFGTDSDRPTVRALVDEVAEVARTMDVRAAIALPPQPMWRITRFAVLAITLASGLLWLPGFDFKHHISPFADITSITQAPADVVKQPTSRDPWPDKPVLTPRLAWEQVEFKDSAISTRSKMLAQYNSTSDDLFSELNQVAMALQLKPSDTKHEQSIFSASKATAALDFEPRRATAEEAAQRLGELEKLWGSPAASAESADQDSQRSEQPEDLQRANAPGDEAANQTVAEEETVDISDPHPDEERMQQQSNRFSSLPESSDGSASDLPPWPKAGPGEGKEDDKERDAEGTGRSSGKPGSGFAQNRRGRATPRIADGRDQEMRLHGLRQAGHQHAYETDLPALSSAAQAQLALSSKRARFTRRAEQALSEEWIPFDSRAQVKRYFRAIEARR